MLEYVVTYICGDGKEVESHYPYTMDGQRMAENKAKAMGGKISLECTEEDKNPKKDGWWLGYDEPPYLLIADKLRARANEHKSSTGEYGDYLIDIEAAQAIEYFVKEKLEQSLCREVEKKSLDKILDTMKNPFVQGSTSEEEFLNGLKSIIVT